MMNKIARIELFHVSIPLSAPFYPSWIPGYPQMHNQFTLIKVTTSEGVVGYSAGPAMGRERAGLGDLLGPYLIGEDATDIALIQQRIREIGYLGWRNYWIEPAFWDIKGKIENKPVYALLGADPCDVNLYAATGEIKPPEARIEEALARYEDGFRTIKLRVHDFDEAVDIRHVTQTAKAIGDKMKIGVDINQGWRVTIIGDAPLWDLARAKRFADACADIGIAWIEEPLPMDAYDDLSALTAYSKVPVGGGELNSAGYPELAMMVARRCFNIFQADAVFTGGIDQTHRLTRLCREQGLSFSPHTWTNGIGFAINLQVFIASGFAENMTLEYPISPPGWTVEARDAILERPFFHTRGKVAAPTDPGLGIAINKRALKKYGQRFFVMDRKRLVWFSLRTRGVKISREIDAVKKAKARAKSK